MENNYLKSFQCVHLPRSDAIGISISGFFYPEEKIPHNYHIFHH